MATYNQLIEGMKIFAQHEGINASVGGASHDVIFGPHSSVQLTPQEIDHLNILGWTLSNEYDCWIKRV